MIKLNKRDMELYISQGYRIPDDLFKDLIDDVGSVSVTVDRQKIVQAVKKLNKKKYLKNSAFNDIDDCVRRLKKIMDKNEIEIEYSYSHHKLVCDLLNFSNNPSIYNTFNLLDLIELTDKRYDYVVIDFKGLLDYMAFEIGYETYDEVYNLRYFDDIFGISEGILYPVSIDKLKKYVPENFHRELANWYLDTSINSPYYVRTSKKVFNYFMQEQFTDMSLDKMKYIPFNEIIQSQNDYITCIILYYILVRANSSVIQCKLVEVKNGRIVLGIGENKFNKEYFKEHLNDSICINLLDRKFVYTPEIIQL